MFILILNQFLKMLIIMVLGFICYKIKLINQDGNRMFSNLLLMLISPCLILTVFQTDYDAELAKKLFISFIAALISHIIALAAARILVPAKNNPEYIIERFAAIYSNCGFIGIPLINSVLGAEGVFYISAYVAVFNLFSWTHGVTLMKGRFSLRYLKNGVLSPVFLTTLAAILMYFIKLRLPPVLLDSVEYIASMNTPLAMLVAGFSVAQADLQLLLKKSSIYRSCFVKLIVVPLLTLFVLALSGVAHDIIYVTLIAAACPTAAGTAMMAMRFDRNYAYASEIFTVSTVFSVLTIPFIILFADFLL